MFPVRHLDYLARSSGKFFGRKMLGLTEGFSLVSKAGHRERTARRWLVDYPRAVPLLIFLLIAAITALSVFAIERSEHQREHVRIQTVSQSVGASLERYGNTGSSYLRAGAALFASVDTVDEPLFRDFVKELRLDVDYRGAMGIGWAEAVVPQELAAYRERVGSDEPSGNGIFPAYADERKWIVPVTFLEPRTASNRTAIGYDMYSNAIRSDAMAEAETLLRPTATGKIKLILQTDEGLDAGFIIYMPVFEGGGVENSGVSRSLKGFIYSPFNAQEFLNSVVQPNTRGLSGIRLYDKEISPDRLMAEIPPNLSTGNVTSRTIMIANRPMVLQIESAFSGSLSQLSMATLMFGLMVASLLMVVARLLTQQALEDRASLAWLTEQNSIRNSLTRELNHRVKNTLANVLSIIALTKRRAKNMDEFADGIDGRIRALSATHDLLTQSEWGTTPIAAVMEAELAPYAQGGDEVVTVSGPPVELAPNEALSLGLAIHELATNAAKYGALGDANGRVSIDWTLDDEFVHLVWKETGGPPVVAERTRGFGTDLIEKVVAYELNSPVELDFAADGVRCAITIPVRTPSTFAIRATD